MTIKNEAGGNCPRSARTSDNIAKAKAFLEANCHVSLDDIALELGISHVCIHNLVLDDIGRQKKGCKMGTLSSHIRPQKETDGDNSLSPTGGRERPFCK